MEKLLKQNNMKVPSLPTNDEMNKETFKKMFNMLQQKENTRTNLKIMLYKPPSRITSETEKNEANRRV